MVDVSHLPLPILRTIFNQVVIYNDCKSSFRANLKYTRICGQWRRVALCSVYRSIYCIFNSRITKCKVDTNIELARLLDKTAHVRSVYMLMNNMEDIVNFLSTYSELFRPDMCDWSRITSIKLTIKHRLPVDSEYVVDGQTVDVMGGFRQFADFITKSMSAVTDIALRYFDVSAVTETLTTRVLDAYHRQLVALHGYHVSSFEKYPLFENLTCLSISANPDYVQMFPRVNVGKLKSIGLADVPFNFSWPMLLGDSSSGVFEFGNLKKLSLAFSSRYTSEELEEYLESIVPELADYRLTLKFPKLSAIHIGNKPSPLVEKTKYVFSSKLRNIVVINSNVAMRMLANVDFGHVEEVLLASKSLDDMDTSEFYSLTSVILGKGKARLKRSTFTADLESLGHVDWRLVRWTWLTHLFLRRCSFIEFISILKHCPSVHTLGIRRFNIEISLDDVHRVMNCKTVLVRETDELSKRMESLCIGEMTGEMCTQEHLASVVKVLLSFLTNLKSLRLVGCPWIRLETYIESMSCYREHLKLLKVHRSHLQHK